MSAPVVGALVGGGVGWIRAQKEKAKKAAMQPYEDEKTRWSQFTGDMGSAMEATDTMGMMMQGAVSGASFGSQFGGAAKPEGLAAGANTPGSWKNHASLGVNTSVPKMDPGVSSYIQDQINFKPQAAAPAFSSGEGLFNPQGASLGLDKSLPSAPAMPNFNQAPAAKPPSIYRPARKKAVKSSWSGNLDNMSQLLTLGK